MTGAGPRFEAARQIRGLYPWPGCRVKLLDVAGKEIARLTLVRARATAGRGETPGAIDSSGHVATGAGGALDVLEVQPEGKRPMPLSDFRNGRPWAAGMRLESIQ